MDENTHEQQETFISKKGRKKAGSRGVSIPPIIWLTAIFLVGIILGNVLWLFTADVLAFGREEKEVMFTVSDTDSLKDIAKDLKKQGLVNYSWLFRLYANVTNSSSKIKPGTYTLNTRYDYHALVKVLSSGKVQRSAHIFDSNQGDIEIKWQNWNY